MIRIAHLTDPHTTSLVGVGFSALLGKRALGYLSWRRKRRHRHTQAMLEATTAAALAHKPDALVLTGDLLHIGLQQEMREIRSWLAGLAEQVPVLLVPGNHDYYATDSQALWNAELGDLPVFGEPVSTEHEWPRRLTIGDVTVLGLCTAYPAPLTRADGQLGKHQRELLAHELEANARTLIALHHPAKASLSEVRKSLLDADELKTLLTRASALVHGHLHKNLAYNLSGVPCYCTASASSVYARALASFRLLEFSNTAVHNRLFVAAKGTPETEFIEEPQQKSDEKSG